MKPLAAEQQRTSLEFFNELNFILQFCPTVPSEKALMARFAKIGVGAGRPFDANALSPEMRKALEDGMADAWATFKNFKETQLDTGKKTSADGFGSRASLSGRYLDRMAGAALGIYGNSKQEAIYPAYFVDSGKQPLNGANRYLINSPMLPNLKRDTDGGITLYVQNESPGKDKEANWLPAPKGPFFVVMRLYWPKPEALDGKWKAPLLQRTK
jgi:hypothetical protein